MPAKLDVDREQVRMLVLSVGCREAARQTGLAESTVQAWSARGGWLQHVTSPAKPGRPASMTPATGATKSPADALEDTISSDGRATKVAAMRYARRTAEHAARLAESAPEEALAQAVNVKAVLGAAQIAGGWSSGAAPALRIAIFAGQSESPVIDV